MASVAVFTLLWKRDNLAAIVEAVKSQTVKPKLYVWNNDPDRFIQESDGPDWVINSSRNTTGLFTSQHMKMCEEDFICYMDDDLTFRTPNALEYAMGHAADDGRLYGAFGVILHNDKPYLKCPGFDCPVCQVNVDIMKYRFMLAGKETFSKVEDGKCNVIHQDIAVSGNLSQGKCWHVLIPHMKPHLKELPNGYGLHDRGTTHYDEREKWRRHYFDY